MRLSCLLARNGGETRRPDREAIVFGVVQQGLPVCTTGVWIGYDACRRGLCPPALKLQVAAALAATRDSITPSDKTGVLPEV